MNIVPKHTGQITLRGTVSATTSTYFHLQTSDGEIVRIDQPPHRSNVEKGDQVTIDRAELEKTYSGYFLTVRKDSR